MIYDILLFNFDFKNIKKKRQVFQKTFLVANIEIEVLLNLLFLAFSKVKIKFIDQKLSWKIDILKKTLLITKQMHMIDWKKFATIALAMNKEAFLLYIIYLECKILIYIAQKALIALLLAKNVDILAEYADFSDFLKDLQQCFLIAWILINMQ